MRSTFKVLFYLKRNKDKDQKVVPVMGRITVNGSIAQFSAKLSVPEMLWEVSGGRAKGRSLEADRINRHLDNIRTQIGKHYQDICDRESYVTAEKVKNAYLGFGEKYRLLLEAFEKFTADLKKRVGIDRCHGTWNRYYKSIDHLRTFMRKEYNVSDMPLAELEQSFIEQYHVYLKSDLGLKPTTVSGYLKCLKYVVKIAFNNGSDAGNGAASAKLNYTNAAFIYKIGPFTVNIFLFIGIILLICSYVFLFKTKWGLRLRACGEHPQAADSVGINVYQWRYTGVIISGALGGIGGFAYIVPSVTTWNFEVGVAGAGFLALAVMIFGQWKPFHIAGAAVFFAVFRSLANIADSTVLSHLGLSKNIYNMMPFIASMIILAFTSKNSQAPKAEGIPYDKGAR